VPGHDIIVIGASAGGVEALQEIASTLPPDFQAAVFVVLHVTAEATSALPAILRRAGPLPASHAVNNEPIRYGRLYIAPPDFHLVLCDGAVRVVHGPRENRSRPAVDPLFRSAAITYGPRVIGVVLSGALDDGTAGLLAIKAQAGVAVVQDPDDAVVSGMPRSALEYVNVDYCAPLTEIGPLLVRLAREPAPMAVPRPRRRLAMEARMATLEPDIMEEDAKYSAQPSPFTCPECHGTLWELVEGNLVRYRCRVGHTYSADSMTVEQGQSTERALWAALRALEEKAALARRLERAARGREHVEVATRFEERARETEENAEIVRRLILTGKQEDELPTIDPQPSQTGERR
jgi:two-component system, chemotaxis family, protein-glutamate methylesterase/glutaminase